MWRTGIGCLGGAGACDSGRPRNFASSTCCRGKERVKVAVLVVALQRPNSSHRALNLFVLYGPSPPSNRATLLSLSTFLAVPPALSSRLKPTCPKTAPPSFPSVALFNFFPFFCLQIMPAPPRAPTFPAFVDEVKDIDDPVLHENKDLSKSQPSPLVDMTDLPSSSPAQVPVVPLPVAQGRSRVRAVLLWRDPKVSALVLGVCVLFFYLTLVKGLTVLSVIGALCASYLLVGSVVVRVNRYAGRRLDRYLTRPAMGTPLLRRDVMYRAVDTVVEEVNDVGEEIRDVLYCEKPGVTAVSLLLSLALYYLGKYCSVLVVLLVATLAAFTLPLLYEKNKKQVDDAVAKATDIASKKMEMGRKVVEERAIKARDVVAAKSAPLLEKAPPAAKNLAEKMGLSTKPKSQ